MLSLVFPMENSSSPYPMIILCNMLRSACIHIAMSFMDYNLLFFIWNSFVFLAFYNTDTCTASRLTNKTMEMLPNLFLMKPQLKFYSKNKMCEIPCPPITESSRDRDKVTRLSILMKMLVQSNAQRPQKLTLF